MITHNDLYSGALGKLRNAGGSDIFTVPHTVSVQPDISLRGTTTFKVISLHVHLTAEFSYIATGIFSMSLLSNGTLQQPSSNLPQLKHSVITTIFHSLVGLIGYLQIKISS